MKKTLKRLSAANTENRKQNAGSVKRNCENVGISGLLSGFHWSKLLIFVTVLLVVLMTLTPAAVLAADGSAGFTVEQTYSTSDSTAAATFTYRLKPLDPENPMPLGSTIDGYTFRITGNASVLIGPIYYSKTGMYVYTINQVIAASNQNYSYDRRVYTVEIHVDESLNTFVIVKNESGNKLGAIEFSNSYNAPDITDPPDTPDPPKPTDPEKPTEPPVKPPTDPPGPIDIPEPPVTNTNNGTDIGDGSTPVTGLNPAAPVEQENEVGIDIDIENTDMPVSGLRPATDGPKTGDDSNTLFDIILFGAGGLLTVTAIVVLLASRKRNKLGVRS